MGSGWSRGKKVAPECVNDVSTSPGVASSKQSSPFRPLKIHGLLRNRAPQDSPGEVSARTAEGEDAQLEAGKKAESKRSSATAKSRSYGLCHFTSEDTEEDWDQQGRASTQPRGGQDVNTRGHARDVRPLEHTFSSQTTLPRGSPVEADAPTHKHKPWSSNGHLAMPVILYNASEQELMDSIEREFS